VLAAEHVGECRHVADHAAHAERAVQPRHPPGACVERAGRDATLRQRRKADPLTSHQSSGIRLTHERDPVPPRRQLIGSTSSGLKCPGSGGAMTAKWARSGLDDELDPFARPELGLRVAVVEHQKGFDVVVGHRHAARHGADRIALPTVTTLILRGLRLAASAGESRRNDPISDRIACSFPTPPAVMKWKPFASPALKGGDRHLGLPLLALARPQGRRSRPRRLTTVRCAGPTFAFAAWPSTSRISAST
jgi:hypothetical protein